MKNSSSKFSSIGRRHFREALKGLAGDFRMVRFPIEYYLRPRIRAVLLKVVAGKGRHPEFLRVNKKRSQDIRTKTIKRDIQ